MFTRHRVFGACWQIVHFQYLASCLPVACKVKQMKVLPKCDPHQFKVIVRTVRTVKFATQCPQKGNKSKMLDFKFDSFLALISAWQLIFASKLFTKHCQALAPCQANFASFDFNGPVLRNLMS